MSQQHHGSIGCEGCKEGTSTWSSCGSCQHCHVLHSHLLAAAWASKLFLQDAKGVVPVPLGSFKRNSLFLGERISALIYAMHLSGIDTLEKDKLCVHKEWLLCICRQEPANTQLYFSTIPAEVFSCLAIIFGGVAERLRTDADHVFQAGAATLGAVPEISEMQGCSGGGGGGSMRSIFRFLSVTRPSVLGSPVAGCSILRIRLGCSGTVYQ